MVMKIDRDASRFKQIVRGKIRENLRKYVTHGEMIGRKGGDLVSIPLPQLDVPHFRYGQNGRGGVGQGDGEVGQPIARGDDGEEGEGKAGSDPGEHVLEVDITLDELATILGDELQLIPASSPRGRPTSCRTRSATRASGVSAPNRCGTSAGRTSRPCGVSFPRVPIGPPIPASCQSRTTAAIGPGSKSPNQWPTQSSFT
jgi:hypothetical protein